MLLEKEEQIAPPQTTSPLKKADYPRTAPNYYKDITSKLPARRAPHLKPRPPYARRFLLVATGLDRSEGLLVGLNYKVMAQLLKYSLQSITKPVK